MNNELNNSLLHAGQDPVELALLDRLEQRRITPEKEIPPMHFLFQMYGKPCFPRGELVAVAGKAKSGKTFVSSILMTLAFRSEVLSIRRLEADQLRVLWFDTEQSEESTQDILVHRIVPMMQGVGMLSEYDGMLPFDNPPVDTSALDNFHIFNVRAEFWQDRMPLLEAALDHYRPDLVVLDGIRDLVNDINDGVMAQDVIERLMRKASEQHCCLVCVLHQNKSFEDKNLRGAIGTELKNKAFEVYECTKDSDRIFTWTQTDTRKYDILDSIKFTVGDDGIPRLCSVEQLLANQTGAPALSPYSSRPLLNPKYVMGYEGNIAIIDVYALFTDAFRPGEQKTPVALQETVMHMANISSYKYYNKKREEALAKHIIECHEEAGDRLIYTCPSKQSDVR